MVQRFIILFFVLGMAFALPAEASKQDDGSRFRRLFAILEGEGSISSLMDRSLWPNNDRLTSYLEFELLFHPRYISTAKRLSRFVKRWPNHPQIKKVRRFLEVRINENSTNSQALAWYDKNPPTLQKGRLRYMQLLLTASRKNEAREIWRKLYTQGVKFPRSLTKQIGNMAAKMSAADHEKRARYFLRVGDKKGLRSVVSLLPAEKKYYLLSLEAAKNAQATFHVFLKKLNKKNARSPELWVARINGLRRYNFLDKAKTHLLGKEGKYLSISDRQKQRFRLAKMFALADKHNTAVKLLDLNIAEMGAKLEDSLWLGAWYSYNLGEKNKALKYFTLLANDSRSVYRRSQGAYWATKISNNAKEREILLQKAMAYPETFYGLLATEESKGYIPVLPEKKLECKPLSDPKQQADLQELQMFVDAGRSYYIGPEIVRLAKKHGLTMNDQLCMAEHFTATNHVIKSAKALQRKGEKYWSGLYPVPKWQPRWGWEVEPSLIWGMARQESLFFHRARSSANAYGLLQLMPATARQEAKQSGFPPSNPFRLRLPDYNLAVGQAYMKRMLQRFNGDLILALTAYNAGPSRADRWSSYRSKEDPLIFIENIPFSETRHYVKRVIQGWMIYQLRLYGAASLKSALGPNQPGITSLLMAEAH